MRFTAVFLCLVLALTGLSTKVAGQLAGDPGVIEVDSVLVQISVQQRNVHIARAVDLDAQHEASQFDRKLVLLAGRIDQHLAMTEAQEERQFSDMEALYRGTNYARKLAEKIVLLRERISYLGIHAGCNRDLETAIAVFDVSSIKRCLQEKLDREDDKLAEAAFQLGGFQELDGEYQDAWGNYQKASNLEPENQLYMDAHGKNEF